MFSLRCHIHLSSSHFEFNKRYPLDILAYLPWHKNSKLVFSRRHTQAPDCANLHDLLHLGRSHFLSIQQRFLTVQNSTNGSTYTLQHIPLTVYHFPCNLTFASETTGYGQCPKRMSFHVLLFTQTTFHYLQRRGTNQDEILRLHYKSLNLSPPVHFDNITIQLLDKTFYLLDGQFSTQMTSLRSRISRLHTVHEKPITDLLIDIAFALALLDTFCIFVFFCTNSRQNIQQRSRSRFFKRARRSNSNSQTPRTMAARASIPTELAAHRLAIRTIPLCLQILIPWNYNQMVHLVLNHSVFARTKLLRLTLSSATSFSLHSYFLRDLSLHF